MAEPGVLAGKRALVTGASRGIGKAAAVALAKAGADVAVHYRERKSEAEEAVAEILALGRRALLLRADVSKADEVARMAAELNAAWGGVDVLVNNAGMARRQPLPEITEADWDEILDVNLKSMFLVTQRFVPGMRERKWGRIVNLSSVAAQVGGVIGPHYAASKSGALGLTHFYASHLAKEGITCNAVAPALVVTEMVTSNPAARPDLLPVGRFGDVSETADVVVMLACNGFVTGQTINVNGGWYMS